MANGFFNEDLAKDLTKDAIKNAPVTFPTPSLFSNLNFGNLLGSLVDTGLQTAGIQNQQQALREFGVGALEGMERIGAQAREDARKLVQEAIKKREQVADQVKT